MFSNWMCFTENESGNIFKLEVVLLTETTYDWAEWKQRKTIRANHSQTFPVNWSNLGVIDLPLPLNPCTRLFTRESPFLQQLVFSFSCHRRRSSSSSVLVFVSKTRNVLCMSLSLPWLSLFSPPSSPLASLMAISSIFCFSLTSLSCFSITCGCKGG